MQLKGEVNRAEPGAELACAATLLPLKNYLCIPACMRPHCFSLFLLESIDTSHIPTWYRS